MNGTLKNAIIYARVSSLGTRQDTERQILDLQKFAERNDYKVLKIVEEHVSGAKYAKEREFNTAFEFAKEHKCVILVSELSRIGRDSADLIKTVENCRKEKVNIYIQDRNMFSLNDDGTENPLFDLTLYVGAMFAKLEREKIKYRLNSGRKHYIENGGSLGRPNGTKDTKEKLLKKDGYAKAVKMIKDGRSYTSIMNEFKGMGMKIAKGTLVKLNKTFCQE
jgi:DNA invertase Pin-like site-specific DNA recombinase